MLFVKCACELRSPAQFTDAGFVAFNRHYVERLAARGIFREEVNLALKKRIDAIKDEAIRRRLKWDHEFESAFLQRRVHCEPDFRDQEDSNPARRLRRACRAEHGSILSGRQIYRRAGLS